MSVASDSALLAQPIRAGRRSAIRQLPHAIRTRGVGPRVRVLVLLVAMFSVSVAAFGHVVEDYLTNDPLVRWDMELNRWLHGHSNGNLVTFMDVVTTAGNIVFLAPLVLAGAAHLLRSRRVGDAILLVAATVGIELGNTALKLLFHRPRPELAFVNLDTYSFPSGHAAGSTAIYAIVLYLLVRDRGRRLRNGGMLAYAVLVTTIGFSRLW